MTWTLRDYTVAEAARLAGLRRETLDVIIHRSQGLETLYSEKRGHRRWFSPQDIAVLRIAHECERAGQTWLTAIARAFEHLQNQPPANAVLTFPAASVSASSGQIRTGTTARIHVTASTVFIPIGRIVAEIVERCQQIKEADTVVALQD